MKVPEGMTDEQALFLSDIFPTGYMGAEMCDIKPGQTIAIWGCGPVGQFAIKSAFMLGAERVIAIDHVPERMRMAQANGAEVISFDDVNVLEALKEVTGGRGPDACIDAVGMEARGHGPGYVYDKTKQAARLVTGRPIALREAIMSVRNGGIVSVIGVYAGFVDKFPIGAVMNRGLTIRAGQCHVHRYMKPLLERIERGEIDPTFVITHKMTLDQAPTAYKLFRDKQDECIKVVLKPDGYIH
jgi:threonine dehydrogenase-like Zn-dependent dehydrogenase